MKRIGVLADNHSRTPDGSDVPQEVVDAFAGVDLIVHCGDAGSWETLDRLERVAPVLGVFGGHNGQGDDERIDGEKRVLAIDGLRVGVVHDLVRHGLTTESAPAFKPTTADFGTALRSFFGEPIDVLFYAGTHVPRVAWMSGVLMVNGGSPTLPSGRPKGSLGTVAIVEFDGGSVTPRIIELAKERSAVA